MHPGVQAIESEYVLVRAGEDPEVAVLRDDERHHAWMRLHEAVGTAVASAQTIQLGLGHRIAGLEVSETARLPGRARGIHEDLAPESGDAQIPIEHDASVNGRQSGHDVGLGKDGGPPPVPVVVGTLTGGAVLREEVIDARVPEIMDGIAKRDTRRVRAANVEVLRPPRAGK